MKRRIVLVLLSLVATVDAANGDSSTPAAKQAFTALQRLGVESKFLYFPDENHWVLKPANTLQWYQTVFDWLDRYLKPGTVAPGETRTTMENTQCAGTIRSRTGGC